MPTIEPTSEVLGEENFLSSFSFWIFQTDLIAAVLRLSEVLALAGNVRGAPVSVPMTLHR